MENKLPPLTNQTLRDQIVHRIYQAISTGRLKPGDRLVEQELAAELNTSRAPIREAIRELVDRGRPVSPARRGTFVATWSAESLTEVYLLRGILEEFALHLAVYHVSDANITRLQMIVDRMTSAAAANNITDVAQEDLAFHRAIIEMSQQHHLMRVWSSLGVEAVIVLSSQKTDPALVPDDHQEMVDALKNRNAERAIELNWKGIWSGLSNDTSISQEALRAHLGPELTQRFMKIVHADSARGWLDPQA